MTELEERLRAGPHSIADLVRCAQRPLSLSDPQHWHGLAEGAAQRANQAFADDEGTTGLSWARCAVEIYDCLAADVREANSFDLSAMNLRAGAIRACGGCPRDSLLDPSVVVAWVRSALDCSVDEAMVRSASFKKALADDLQPAVEEARALRRIKSRLGVLLLLADAVPVAADLRAWMEVRGQLV